MKTSARIPDKYVVVQGAGQSDFGPGLNPWATTTYDMALLDAGLEIANCNIVKYTSVLPPQAQRLSMKEALLQNLFHHGMVLESIMAQVNGRKGEHICAGIGVMRVAKETPSGLSVIGGFAAEYEGNQSPDDARKILEESLDGIFDRRYGDNSVYRIEDQSFFTQDLVVDCDFGTVLVALGFVSFILVEVKD